MKLKPSVKKWFSCESLSLVKTGPEFKKLKVIVLKRY